MPSDHRLSSVLSVLSIVCVCLSLRANWTVSTGATTATHVRLTTSLGGLLVEARLETGRADEVVTAAKALAWSDEAECGNHAPADFCADCRTAAAGAGWSLVGALVASLVSLSVATLRNRNDSTEARSAAVAAGLSAALFALSAMLTYAKACDEPASLGGLPLTSSGYACGWVMACAAVAAQLLVAVLHARSGVSDHIRKFAHTSALRQRLTTRAANNGELPDDWMSATRSDRKERGVSFDEDGKSNVWAIEPQMREEDPAKSTASGLLVPALSAVAFIGLAAVVTLNLPDPNTF